MRCIYNCVKLVLLIACLGFAGQSSAAKGPKLECVEIGGLQFKCEGDKLLFRFADSTKQYIESQYKGNEFHDANGNIFLQAIDTQAVFENTEEGAVKPEFRKCPLIHWMIQCDGSHSSSRLTGKPLSKDTIFRAGILCQTFANDLLEQLKTNGSCFKWSVDNCSFLLAKGKGFTVRLGSNDEIALNDYLEEDGSLKGSCGCVHKKARLGNKEVLAFAFLDVSKITKRLMPLVKALTSNQEEEWGGEEGTGEDFDFGGFGDLF